jgi:hypothetical protein
VHGNVPVREVHEWALWMCDRLRSTATDEGKPDTWVVLCNHVEHVKSFAPTIAHYVADVYLGPPEGHPRGADARASSPSWAGMILSDGRFVPAPRECPPPSCALSPDGALSQEWLR